ncbi:hypothetical protein BASA61_009106 [Batrachochytrium salamandrivorans]|nr:hypothetical protein BASA61_009106 [Batrachochytrium salamandrivorans]
MVGSAVLDWTEESPLSKAHSNSSRHVKKVAEKGPDHGPGTFLAKKEFGDWADDVQELPTAPSASHGNEDYNSRGGRDYDSRGGGDRYNSDRRSDLPIPTMPPYTVYMGNLSYEVSERDITMFFGEEISGVRLPEGEDGQGRGFGYVEFADRPSIIAAVGMSGEKFMNRLVRINAKEKVVRTMRNLQPTGVLLCVRLNLPMLHRVIIPLVTNRMGYGRGYGRDREGDSRSGFGRSTRDDDFNAMVSETGWRSRGAPAAIPPAAAPMVRRKLELAPRTLPDPVILITQEATPAAEEAPVAPRKSSVNPFGVAKPRDEAEIQQLKRKQEEEAREKADLQRKADQEQREKEAEAKRVAALAKAAAAAEKSTSTANNIHSTKKSVAVEPVVLPSNWRRQEDLPPVQPKFKGKPFAADQKTRTHGGARDKTDRAPMTVKRMITVLLVLGPKHLLYVLLLRLPPLPTPAHLSNRKACSCFCEKCL